MNKIIEKAIEEKAVTILLAVVMLIAGIYSYYFIPKQESPDVTSPAAQIVTVFPGANAEEIEALVTIPIEDKASEIDGVDYIQSFSNDNVSVVIVFLDYETDKETQWTKLSSLMDSLQNDLPDGVEPISINTDLTETTGMIISLSGQDYTYEELAIFAQYFKENLGNVDGVKRIDVDGALESKLVIEVQNEKISQLDLAITEIYQLIQAQNVAIPAGSIDGELGKISLNVPDSIENLTDVENIIVGISPETGSIIRIGDVANVYFEYEDGNIKYRQNQQNSVLISGYFDKGQNAVLIGKDVRIIIDKLKSELPENLYIDEIVFQPEEVDNSITAFIVSLLQGVIFVVVVVLIGMGWRNALVVSAAIPLSIAITFVSMYLFGFSIEQMSITALIIALGILVDNSIVISDAIQVHVNEGMDIKKACYIGTKESSIPILTSTLTTVAAFATMLTLDGEAGEFAKSLPIVVIIALFASYLVAMFITPTLASLVYKPKIEVKKDRKIRKIFTKLLVLSLKKPIRSMILVVSIFAICLLGAIKIPINLFPFVDKDIIYMDIRGDKTGDIDNTQDVIERAEKLLVELEEIGEITTSIGGGLPKFYTTVFVTAPADDVGQVYCTTDLSNSEFKSKKEFQVYLQDLMDRKLLGGSADVQLLALKIPGPDVEVKISSNDMDEMSRVSQELYDKLLIEDETINVKNNISKEEYEYILDIDEDKAFNLGLTKYDIQYQINMSLSGMTASVLRQGGNEYDLFVTSNVETINDIENLYIKSGFTDEKIMVKQIADVSLGTKLGTLNRYNRIPTTIVSANIRPGYSISAFQSYMEEELIDPIGVSEVTINYAGEKETFTRYVSGLGLAGAIALFAIYIILLIQFNSLKQPAIILATVPLSLIGMIIVLLFTGMEATFMVLLGILSLVGIVVNNAILLIEYINRARERGMSVYEACITSVDRRFRPIMLSSITTVMGLVPLAVGGSSFYKPMAVALMGGLMVSTFLTLIVVPTIYSLVTNNEEN